MSIKNRHNINVDETYFLPSTHSAGKLVYLFLGQSRIRVSPLGKEDFDLGPAFFPSLMELVAKKFNSVIETSFEQHLCLFLQILVLFSCSKPGFTHGEMASREENGTEENPETREKKIGCL